MLATSFQTAGLQPSGAGTSELSLLPRASAITLHHAASGF